MIFADKNALENTIIEILHHGPLNGPALLRQAMIRRPHTSKETFYRELRALLQSEVIIKNKSEYTLGSRWLEQLYSFSQSYMETTSLSGINQFFDLSEGDQITYHFKNAKSMYNYWAYMYDIVFEKHDRTLPILIYHPHEWFIYGRREAEQLFLSRFTKRKQHALLALGGSDELDREFRKSWASDYLSIGTGHILTTKQNEYVNILGVFIFKVSMSVRFARDIDHFFKTYKTVTAENMQELQHICERPDRAKITFMRSKTESGKWRTKFKKYFYFPSVA